MLTTLNISMMLNKCIILWFDSMFLSMLNYFAFTSFLEIFGKKLKQQILTSIWSGQHPNPGQNIQHPSFLFEVSESLTLKERLQFLNLAFYIMLIKGNKGNREREKNKYLSLYSWISVFLKNFYGFTNKVEKD